MGCRVVEPEARIVRLQKKLEPEVPPHNMGDHGSHENIPYQDFFFWSRSKVGHGRLPNVGEMAPETCVQRLCRSLKIGCTINAHQMVILNGRRTRRLVGMLLATRLSQALALEGSRKQAGYPQAVLGAGFF